MKPIFFETPARWRAWLERNHDRMTEVWVGFYRKGSGHASITWPEAVDEALCFGWIDGIRKRIDDEAYMIRFTPRRPTSIWSAVNTRRAEELIAEGRMHPAGVAAFELRDPERTNRYSFEQQNPVLDPEFEKRLRAVPEAWRYFSAQPPGYKRTATWWIMSARRVPTRLRRLEILIECSARGLRIPATRR